MSADPPTVAELRRLLAARRPAAPAAGMGTGVPALDAIAGGLLRGVLTEIVCAAPSCGGHLLLAALLAAMRAQRGRTAWVDAADTLDPASFPEDDLAPLLWVRCRGLDEALAAADLLARDANLALVGLDLRRVAPADLRRTAATSWWRLQRAVEASGLALVVETPCPVVPSAGLRCVLERSWTLPALASPRPGLIAGLAPAVRRQRLGLAGAAG